MNKFMLNAPYSGKIPKIPYIIPLGLTFLLGLSSCGLSPQKIKENAEKEAQKFAQPLGLTLTSCTGNDSDLNNYVSCTFKDKNGNVAEGECAYDPSVNAGCKFKNSFNLPQVTPLSTPQ